MSQDWLERHSMLGWWHQTPELLCIKGSVPISFKVYVTRIYRVVLQCVLVVAALMTNNVLTCNCTSAGIYNSA